MLPCLTSFVVNTPAFGGKEGTAPCPASVLHAGWLLLLSGAVLHVCWSLLLLADATFNGFSSTDTCEQQ
jgi:hypothetical protein